MSAGGGFDILHVVEILAGALPVAIVAYVAIKVDNAVLKTKQTATDQNVKKIDLKIDKIDGVLVTLAEQKGRMDRMDDRQVMSGGRLDELTRRFNEWTDRREESRRD